MLGSSRSLRAPAAVGAVAAIAAVVVADPHPTGVDLIDVVLTVGLVLTVCLAAARARRWTWLVVAGTAATVATGMPAVPLAIAGLAIALAVAVMNRPAPVVGSVVAGCAVVALLSGSRVTGTAASAFVTTAAILPVLVSGYQHGRRIERRWARRGALAAGLVVAIGVTGAALATAGARPSLERAIRQLQTALDTANEGEPEVAAAQFREAARSFEAAEGRLSTWLAEPARAVPVLAQNLDALDALSEQAAELARVAADGATEADSDALRVRDGRLDLAALAALEDPLARVAVVLDDSDARIEAIDSPWLVPPVDRRVERLRDEVDDAEPDAQLALDAVRAGPDLLGGTSPRRYLMLFTTPVEARGRFGFPGNFAELTLTDGKLDMTRFGRVSELEQGLTATSVAPAERRLTGPADYLARYSRFRPAATWRNITVSPDLGAIAEVAGQLYPQSGGTPIDGVLVMDPAALAELMVDTGPVAVPGLAEPVGAENAEQFLLRDQYLSLPDTPERIDALETIARTSFERLTTGALPGPRALADRYGPLAAAGHLAFTSLDPQEADLLDRLGIGGRVEPLERDDGLFVTSINASGNKIDLFLERTLSYDASWDPRTGTVAATATVTLRNTAPPTGLPDYLIGNAVGQTSLDGSDLPPGTNRTYLSLYSPLTLESATLDGQPISMQSEQELDRFVHSTFVTLAPGQSTTIEVKLIGRVRARLVLCADPRTKPSHRHRAGRCGRHDG